MKYKLEEYFCIYLDILGYSNRLTEISDREIQTEFENFIRYVISQNDFLEEFSKLIPYKIKFFSDNIFIALPVTTETINDFHLVLKHVLDYQKTLILSNYFIRGGIVKGKLYFDERIVWGPALVEAVKLEKDAEYPFISISKDILDLFFTNNLLSDTNEYLSVPLIRIKKDNYFLDYLQTTIHTENGKPVTYYTFLESHQSLVKYHLQNSIGKIFEKYKALAEYHNEFCNFYRENFPDMQHFKIEVAYNGDLVFKRKYLRFLIE